MELICLEVEAFLGRHHPLPRWSTEEDAPIPEVDGVKVFGVCQDNTRHIAAFLAHEDDISRWWMAFSYHASHTDSHCQITDLTLYDRVPIPPVPIVAKLFGRLRDANRRIAMILAT